MATTIPMAMHNMAPQIEDETLPWYLFNSVIDPETVEFLQYKYIIK